MSDTPKVDSPCREGWRAPDRCKIRRPTLLEHLEAQTSRSEAEVVRLAMERGARTKYAEGWGDCQKWMQDTLLSLGVEVPEEVWAAGRKLSR